MTDANDPSQDGILQRLAGEGLASILEISGFPAGVLIVLAPTGRVIPVAAARPGLDPIELLEDLLVTALEQVRSRRLSTKPAPLPPNG